MSSGIQNIFYIGKNIELVKALLNTLADNKKPSYHIDHKIWCNEIIELLSMKQYHYFITEQALPKSLSEQIKHIFPQLITTCLNVPEVVKEPLVVPELISDDVKSVLNLISIPIYYKDKEGNILLCNKSFANHLGFEVDDVIGKNSADFLPRLVNDEMQAVDEQMYEDRQVHLYECDLYDLNGRRYEVVFRKEFIASSDLQIGIVFDVSELNEARRETEKEHMMLRATADVSPDLIFFKDLQSRFLGCNKQFEKFIGQPEEKIVGKTDELFFGSEQAMMCQYQDKDVMTKNEIYAGEEYLTYVNGESHFIEMQKVPLLDKKGEVRGLIGIGRDITAQHRLQKRLKVADAVFENSQDNIVVTDQNGKIVSANDAACQLFGYQKEELLGNTIRMLSTQEPDAPVLEQICKKLAAESIWKGDITYRNKLGEIHFGWLDIYLVELEEGETNCIYTLTDLIQNKNIESKIQFLSKHDPLTGLANRIALFAKLEDAIHRANFNETAMAVILIDINDFKMINDQYGHNEGDKVLQEIACRLKNCVLEKDSLARFGDDEFVIVVDGLKNEHDAALVAKQVLDQFNSSFKIGDIEATLSATIGISLCPDDGVDVDTLLLSAEKATLRGKQEKVSSYRFYTDQLTEHSSHQLQLEAELKLALQEDQFEIYYQPQYDLNKKIIIGIESLLRWNHPQNGLVFPERFISLAEESGLIVSLGLKVIEKVAQQTVRWKKANIYFGRVAINLSLRQLEQISLIADIQTIIKNTGCSTSDIEFEILEKTFTSDNNTVYDNLFNIKKLGIAITISGFGSDRPIFHFVEPLGIEKFKIAEDYAQHVPGRIVGNAMIKSLLVLARELGVDVVGEVQNRCEQEFIDGGLMAVRQGASVQPMRASEATFYLRCHKKK